MLQIRPGRPARSSFLEDVPADVILAVPPPDVISAVPPPGRSFRIGPLSDGPGAQRGPSSGPQRKNAQME
eukprot:2905071-Pyramimonas_sp.AAC.1